MAEDAPPPPYSASIEDIVSYNDANPDSMTFQLHQHLISLSDQIRSTQQARSVQRSIDDSTILDRISPCVERFLADLGQRHPTPPLATLTLVPDGVVPEKAKLSGMEDMQQRGELCKVARIRMGTDEKNSKSSSEQSRAGEKTDEQGCGRSKEYSDWGRFGDSSYGSEDSSPDSESFWWRDEDMAIRLAGYLQPKIDPKKTAKVPSAVQAVVESELPPEKEKWTWGWGKGKTVTKSNTQSLPANLKAMAGQSSVGASEQSNERPVRMSAAAQEVAFRSENDFGILESISGWAVVVTVWIRNW
ncbi:hypothetical protein F5Y15DRAFT_415381 [Xylariaceae sp. FL0016]|nr:hypothetical protein F5Y15DRAFT_415381 [Xylariaceae sp. FL0016]